jgi:adenylate cyclase
VRITGQLIDTTTGAHIWADRFDGALDDIFELQDRVASSVVGAIEPRLRFSEMERAARKPTQSLHAYDLYLRALAQSHTLTPEGVREAIRLLQRALELDASYAPAAAMVGWCRVLQAVQGWLPYSDADVAAGVHLAKQALEAGKDDPDVLWMGGFTIVHLAGEHAAGAGAVARALALNPNSAHAWMVNGYVDCFMGHSEPAITATQQAMRLSPLDPLGYMFKQSLGLAHLVAGRHVEAMEWVDQSLSEQPRFLPAVRLKLVLCGYLGRIEEAKWWLKRVLELHPGLTVVGFNAFATTFFLPEVRAIYMEGLRKAGMPDE